MALKKFGPLLIPEFGFLNSRVRVKWILAALVLAPVLAFCYVALGGAPTAADRPDSWAARHFLHFAFKRSVAAGARYVIPPDDLNAPGRIKLGAQGFSMVCANCHGAPGAGQSVVALSMNPRPQYLPHVVGQFTDSELFVIIRDGVHFSAMPAWPTAMRGDEIWSMVAFVRQLPKMDAATYASLAAHPDAKDAPAIAREANAALRPADARNAAPPADEFLYAAPATGFGAPVLASNPTAVCAGCHGAGDGAPTQGEAPNLTIQDGAYLRAALEAYVGGARKSGYMREIASQLSSAQIDALAEHYGNQPAATSPARAQADAAILRRGEEIALRGVPETATPACANCHDGPGAKISGAPRIAGQSAVYLQRQLTAFRTGGRGATGLWNPMPTMAHDFSDADITSLAAYYASLAPTKGKPAAMVAVVREGDPDKGHARFDAICSKCHMQGGRGDADGLRPDLTLQSAAYVTQTLQAFRAEQRGNNKMFEVAQSLNFGEIADLAAYVQSLAPQVSTARPAAGQASGEGADMLASHGDPARGVPACNACHGADGVSALPLVPRLNGQSAQYLQARLDSFANAGRGDVSGLNPMPQIASRLTAQERAALAVHFANAPLLQKTQTTAAIH